MTNATKPTPKPIDPETFEMLVRCITEMLLIVSPPEIWREGKTRRRRRT